MKFVEAIQKFKLWREFNVKQNTVKGYDMILRQLCLFTGNIDIEDISVDMIMEWFRRMRELEWDHNSFMPKAMAIRKFLEFYNKQGYSVVDPWLVPIPAKQYKLPRVADEENYQKLINIIPKESNDPRHIRNLAIINMLWDTGARNGEVLSLNVDQLDLDQQKAVINTEKSKGIRPFRELFWTAETNDNIKRWLEKREYLKNKMEFQDKDALFISACSQKVGQRFSIKGTGEMLRRYCNRASIPYMNAHSFRHHMGHDIIKKGGSSADVMNILGHATVQSSTIYTMMTNKELESRYRLFKGA